MKKLIVALVAALVAGAVFAQYTPVTKESAVLGDATATSATVSGFIVATANAASATDGQAVALSGTLTVLTGIGGANDTTNTITLAVPGTVGKVAVIAVSSTSSNLIAIADSGNVNLSAAWLGDNDDTITLIATATNKWTEIARSNQ